MDVAGKNIFLAFADYEHLLESSLDAPEKVGDHLYASTSTHSPWAQWIGYKAKTATAESISKLAEVLLAEKIFWSDVNFKFHRRGSLISENLPQIKDPSIPWSGKHLPFAERKPIGMWFLTTQENIIYCPQTNLPFPKGMVKFQESKIPPSRAYLKLWEVFTLHCQPPDRKSRVLDFGASPGGWTWVLNDLGCDILALDRSELHPNLMRLPNVEFRKCDAFSVKPSDIGPIDMFCSDIAAYPDKLFDYVNLWIQSGLCKRFICTIKLQGTESQWAKTGKYPWEPFTSIKGSRIVHLWNNKNELTWMYNISI